MKMSWRKNPRTEDGWFKRTAISLLISLGVFTVTLAVGFLLFLSHLQSAYPNDTQNFLEAITASVFTGLFLAGLCFAGCMSVGLLLSFRSKSVNS